MHIPTKIIWMIFCFAILGCSATEKDSIVAIHTKLGIITVVLFDDTPLHKESFISMAKEGQYDSTTFYRVISKFMVQGGDVSTKPGFESESKRLISAEIKATHLHLRGALAAARQGDNINPERKSSTQFYIVDGRTYSEKELTTNVGKLNYAAGMYLQSASNLPLRDSLAIMQEQGKIEEVQAILIELKEEIEEYTDLNLDKSVSPEQIELYTTIGGVPHLDGDYTVFGQVLEGMEVVDKIAMLKTDRTDKPFENIFLTMEVIEVHKSEITKKYGYEYPTEK